MVALLFGNAPEHVRERKRLREVVEREDAPEPPHSFDLDDGKYAYSWYENAPDGVPTEATVDGDATGAGLTSHL